MQSLRKRKLQKKTQNNLFNIDQTIKTLQPDESVSGWCDMWYKIQYTAILLDQSA